MNCLQPSCSRSNTGICLIMWKKDHIYRSQKEIWFHITTYSQSLINSADKWLLPSFGFTLVTPLQTIDQKLKRASHINNVVMRPAQIQLSFSERIISWSLITIRECVGLLSLSWIGGCTVCHPQMHCSFSSGSRGKVFPSQKPLITKMNGDVSHMGH